MKVLILCLAVFGLCLVGTSVFAEGIDEYTVLMLHCNGADGSTNFVDDSGRNHIVTANGNAQIDTSQSKFGGSSGKFDGNGDYLSIPDSDDCNFGNGNFTIDFWLNFNTVTDVVIMSQDVNGDKKRAVWGVEITPSNGHFWFVWSSDGVDYHEKYVSLTPVTDTWYHFAVIRSGTSLYFFINGTQQGDIQEITGQIYDGNQSLRIGLWIDDSFCFNGNLDEVRISKGIARWTSDFTPPTAEYTSGPVIPPIAHAGSDGVASAGEEVTLDGSSSYDPDGTIVSWVWRSLSDPQKPIVAEGEVATLNAHGYVEELIELTVTDNQGNANSDTMKITHPGIEGPPGPPGIAPEEVAVMQNQIATLQEENNALQQQNAELQQQNAQQQTALDQDRYLLGQLPQLKNKMEELER
jgi:hypothetical protein